MTAKKRFARFSGVFLGLVFAFSRADASDIQASLSASQASDGSLVMITVTLPPELRNKEISGNYEGVELPFFSVPERGEGIYEAVLGVPYNHSPGQTQVRISVNDEHEVSLPLTVVSGEYRSEQLKVDPRRVNPRKKDLIRIRKEVKEVAAIYSQLTRERYWKGPFALPVESEVTSSYGTKRLFNGSFASFHGGLDLRAPTGTPIRAPARGKVVMAKSLFFTGKTVILDHGYGVVTVYAHLSKLRVKKGDQVDVRQLLGLSGATGRASGPHLHWQAVVHKTKVNPLDLTRVLR